MKPGRQQYAMSMIVVSCVSFTLSQSSSAQLQPLKLDPQVELAQQERIEAIDRASRVTISVFDPEGAGGGSGVVISPDGYALTNYHVVQPCGNFMRCSMPDGMLYDAVLVGLDPTGDVAMIKLLGRDDFAVAEMGDSDQVRVGQWCFAVGNPFLLATNRQPTVTYGIVSGVHRYQYPAGSLLEYADCIQTDAAINPGNSGGPLFNHEGKLIGINGRGSFEKRGRVNVGVGYAISINQIKHFEDCLRAGRIVDHATLGATVTNREGRIVVSNILTSSDASRRGLQYNDEIISFAGRKINSVNDFKNILGTFPKGWRVPLVYERDGQQHEIFCRLAGVHAESALIDLIQGKTDKPEIPLPKPNDEKDENEGDQDKNDKDKNDKEKDEQEKDEQDEKGDKPKTPDEEQPLPPEIPFGPHKTKAEIPDSAQKFITEKRGYANFWFNQLNRDRLWNAWSGQLDRNVLGKNWKINGRLVKGKFATDKDAKGEPIEMLIGDVVSGGRFPSGPELIDLQSDAADQLSPDNSGGLLLALSIWRRLVKEGPEKFGDVYYFGSLPLPLTNSKHDVLVATRDLNESHLYISDETKMPQAMEMFPDVNADPSELHFADYRAVDKCMMPFEIKIVHAGKIYGHLLVDSYEFVVPKEQQE